MLRNRKFCAAFGNRLRGIRHLINEPLGLRLEAFFWFRLRNAERFRVEFCRWEGEMIHTHKIRLGILALGIVLGSSLSSQAQQTTQPDTQQLRSYKVSRESFLLGTVVKFTTASDTPPMGAHVILQM